MSATAVSPLPLPSPNPEAETGACSPLQACARMHACGVSSLCPRTAEQRQQEREALASPGDSSAAHNSLSPGSSALLSAAAALSPLRGQGSRLAMELFSTPPGSPGRLTLPAAAAAANAAAPPAMADDGASAVRIAQLERELAAEKERRAKLQVCLGVGGERRGLDGGLCDLREKLPSCR